MSNAGSRTTLSVSSYAITVLLSSFLIFQVQPLISKYILPWFGGTPGVWTACMLFFQVVLFAGYAYAHFSIRCLTPRVQFAVHTLLIVAALALLPITPGADWKPTGPEDPTLRILGLLLVSVGLPYFILSSTGPLLQAWFSRTSPGASPYRLYALSNLGSVVGLVTYPFVVEPLLAADVQASLWSWSFAGFALACSLCAVQMLRNHTRVTVAGTAHGAVEEQNEAPPTAGVRWLWFGLAACATVMLLATTNQVCIDVAVIPFLWVLPLTLYLVSFIICFDHERWYPRGLFLVLLAMTMVGLLNVMEEAGTTPILRQIAVYFSALFVCCMVCHGELVRLKPSPRYLTSFYLSSSAGGAAGGILVGLVAPLVFHQCIELHIAMLACCLMALVVLFRDRQSALYRGRLPLVWACLLVGVTGLGWKLWGFAGGNERGNLAVARNFYGVLRVAALNWNDRENRVLHMVHGRTLHGKQFVAEEKRRVPTTYYAEDSGIGLLLRHYSQSDGKRFGVVGLGVGTLAAYGQQADYARFYEINPDVIRLAKQHFTYLKDCPAKVDVVLGDGRLSMERESPQQFDVLALDAFSSDAIPVHLLTREAFEIYLRQIKPEGSIAIHITNRHFDLEPVVTALGAHFGLGTIRIAAKGDQARGQNASTWMLLTADRGVLDDPEIATAASTRKQPVPAIRLWTDNYSNVIGALSRNPGFPLPRWLFSALAD